MANLGLEVFAKHAFFLKPDKQQTLESYDFLTPLAAKGIFESIYWHPGVTYIFDEFRILSPVQFEPITIRRLSPCGEGDKVLKFLALKDVHYLILGHCKVNGQQNSNSSTGKILGIFKDRALKQKAYKEPYLGIPEFPCQYKWVDPMSDLSHFHPIHRSGDLGIMLYGLRNENGRLFPKWFHATMKQGIIPLKSIRVQDGRGSRVVNKGNGDYT